MKFNDVGNVTGLSWRTDPGQLNPYPEPCSGYAGINWSTNQSSKVNKASPLIIIHIEKVPMQELPDKQSDMASLKVLCSEFVFLAMVRHP